MSHDQFVEYSAGFLLSHNREFVALIQKKRPVWQAGLFNAIGGHVELGESPEETMIREFREETGCSVVNWTKMGTLTRAHTWAVHFFFKVETVANHLKTLTDEVVGWQRVDEMLEPAALIVPNLRWLLPMVVQGDVRFDEIVQLTPTDNEGNPTKPKCSVFEPAQSDTDDRCVICEIREQEHS